MYSLQKSQTDTQVKVTAKLNRRLIQTLTQGDKTLMGEVEKLLRYSSHDGKFLYM